MNNIVDHHGRSQTACTKAGYTLNGKQAVFGSMLTGFHPDCFIHSIGNVIRAADVAGSTITTFHNIFSFCFEREVAVECGNTINLRRAAKKPAAETDKDADEEKDAETEPDDKEEKEDIDNKTEEN